jgi:hypothetical protein
MAPYVIGAVQSVQCIWCSAANATVLVDRGNYDFGGDPSTLTEELLGHAGAVVCDAMSTHGARECMPRPRPPPTVRAPEPFSAPA